MVARGVVVSHARQLLSYRLDGEKEVCMFRQFTTREIFRQIHSFEETCARIGASPDALADMLAEMKREVRRRRDAYRPSRGFHPYGDETVTEIVTLPDHIRSRDDAEAYYEEWIHMPRPCSPYDCTGAMFTKDHHVGVIGGRWVCWHTIGIDI